MAGVQAGRVKLELGLVYVCLYMLLVNTGSTNGQCGGDQCQTPDDSFIATLSNNPQSDDCFNDSAILLFDCSLGFRQNGDNYTTTCNGSEWTYSGSCDIDVLSLIIAVITMIAIFVIFGTCIVCLRSRRTRRLALAENQIANPGPYASASVPNRAFIRHSYETRIGDEHEGIPPVSGNQIGDVDISKTNRRKAMYDTSIGASEVIDGHLEEGGAYNINMNDIQTNPRRVIQIEDPYDGETGDVEMGIATGDEEMGIAKGDEAMGNATGDEAMGNATGNEEMGNATSSDQNTMVDIHINGDNNVAIEDTIDGYGVIGECTMTPTDPQAGSSTEHLIDMTRDEPDGEATLGPPYANIDRPLTRNRDSETTVGGSVKERPITSPKVFSAKSASVRKPGPNDDEIDVEAMYAKVNRVKRASSRWPPGSKDPTPADASGWHRVDEPVNGTGKYPTEPATGERIKEDLYAEVDHNDRESVRSAKVPPTVAKKPKSRVRKQTSPSTAGDSGVLYAMVDRSRSSSRSSFVDSNFAPPSPPPIDGTDGLYAQIDRDRNSKEDLSKAGLIEEDNIF